MTCTYPCALHTHIEWQVPRHVCGRTPAMVMEGPMAVVELGLRCCTSRVLFFKVLFTHWREDPGKARAAPGPTAAPTAPQVRENTCEFAQLQVPRLDTEKQCGCASLPPSTSRPQGSPQRTIGNTRIGEFWKKKNLV